MRIPKRYCVYWELCLEGACVRIIHLEFEWAMCVCVYTHCRVYNSLINLSVRYLEVNFKSTILCTNTSTQEKLKVVKLWRTPIRITWELKLNSPSRKLQCTYLCMILLLYKGCILSPRYADGTDWWCVSGQILSWSFYSGSGCRTGFREKLKHWWRPSLKTFFQKPFIFPEKLSNLRVGS